MNTPAQRFWMTMVSWGGVSVVIVTLPKLVGMGATAAAWVQGVGAIVAILAGFAGIEFTRRGKEREVRKVGVGIADNAYQAILQTAQALRKVESNRYQTPYSYRRPQLTISLDVMDDAVKQFPFHDTGHAEFGKTLLTLRVLLSRAKAEVINSNADRAADRSTEPEVDALERLADSAEATLHELRAWA